MRAYRICFILWSTLLICGPMLHAQDTLSAHVAFVQAKQFRSAKQIDSALLAYHKSIRLFRFAAFQEQDTLIWKRCLWIQMSYWNWQLELNNFQQIVDSVPDIITQVEQHLGPGRIISGSLHRIRAAAFFELGKYERALASYRDVQQIWTKTGDSTLTAKIYTDLGMCIRQLGRIEEGLAYLDSALTIFTQLKHQSSKALANLYANIGIATGELGDQKAAISYFQQGVDILIEANGANDQSLITYYLNLGNSYSFLNDLEQAEHYCHLAMELALSSPGKKGSHLFAANASLARLYEQKGDNYTAQSYYQQAIDVAIDQFGDDYFPLIYAYNNLAVVYDENGDRDQALLYYQRAIDLGQSILGEGFDELPVIISNMAGILESKNQYALAKQYNEQAIQITQKALGAQHPFLSDYYINLSRIYRIEGDFRKSRSYLQQALIHGRTYLDDKDAIVHEALWNLGNLSQKEGKFDQALSYFTEAYQLKKAVFGNHHPEVARYLNSISELYLIQKNFSQAIQYSEKAIKANISPKVPMDAPWPPPTRAIFQPKYLLTSYQLQAQALSALEQTTAYMQADTLYQHALMLVEEVRNTYLHQQSQLALQDSLFPLFGAALQILMTLHQQTGDSLYLHRAYEVAERSKASILRLSLQEISAKEFAGIPAEILELERELKVDLSYYEKLLYGIEGEGDSLSQENWRKKVFQLKIKFDSLQSAINEQYPNYYTLKYAQDLPSLEEVQAYVDQREAAMVEYVLGVNNLFVFVIQGNSIHSWMEPIPDSLKAHINTLRQNISAFEESGLFFSYNNDELSKIAYSLYRELFSKIHEQLDSSIHSLFIIPNGLLGYVPFEILLTDSIDAQTPYTSWPYLLQSYAISYSYSSSLLLQGNSHVSYSRKGVAGFAPSYDDFLLEVPDSLRSRQVYVARTNAMPLPGALNEVRKIQEIWGGDGFLKEEATERNFREKAHQYQILHLAMHAFLEDSNSLYSHLLFTNTEDSSYDGSLHTSELYTLSLNADLAILSACNTGVGELKRGEGIMSLSRAFAYAGVPSTVMSLWRIPDDASSFLMPRFHQYLKDGMTKSQALTQARLDYLTETKSSDRTHPFFWAGFVLNGDIDPIELQQDSTWVRGGIFVLILLCLGLLLPYFRSRMKSNPSKPE